MHEIVGFSSKKDLSYSSASTIENSLRMSKYHAINDSLILSAKLY